MATPNRHRSQFATGDRVVASCHLGGFFRRRVLRGTRGIVFGLIDSTTLCVEFEGGATLDVNADDVVLAVPPA